MHVCRFAQTLLRLAGHVPFLQSYLTQSEEQITCAIGGWEEQGKLVCMCLAAVGSEVPNRRAVWVGRGRPHRIGIGVFGFGSWRELSLDLFLCLFLQMNVRIRIEEVSGIICHVLVPAFVPATVVYFGVGLPRAGRPCLGETCFPQPCSVPVPRRRRYLLANSGPSSFLSFFTLPLFGKGTDI